MGTGNKETMMEPFLASCVGSRICFPSASPLPTSYGNSMKEPLMSQPETLRSTQLPNDILAGTRLFLRFYEGKRQPYVVETRWQTLRRAKDVTTAATLFEDIACGHLPPLP
jgi:hypothetical protein